jgi:hypothetical protein
MSPGRRDDFDLGGRVVTDPLTWRSDASRVVQIRATTASFRRLVGSACALSAREVLGIWGLVGAAIGGM